MFAIYNQKEEVLYLDICNHIKGIEYLGGDVYPIDLRRLQDIYSYIQLRIKLNQIPDDYIWRWQYTQDYLKSLIKN